MKYYVYQHIDPDTQQVVYIGKGCGGRAWDVTRCRSQNKDHQDWMVSLCQKGFVPSDWVIICHKNLSEAESFLKETEWFHLNGQPKFNRTSGEKNHQSKLTDSQAREIFTLTKTTNQTHKNIAKDYNVSRAAVSMIASRKQWRAATACLI
jgi:hypothetical protein